MKYYKAMNKDMSCRGFQYEIGKTYNLRRNQNLELCKRGFHFCDILANCFNYYEKYNSIICEVEPLGRIIHSGNENKLVTDRIKIIRQLSNEEIKKEQYIIQDGIEMIGDGCFNYCTGLKEITIPNSVTYIGKNAFYGCELLEKINIPDSVTYIGNNAFSLCKSLKEVTIPNKIRYISDNTFNKCIHLKKINIPSSVSDIGDCAFMNCESLEEIDISNNVTSIGIYAFTCCDSLKNIFVDKNNKNYSSLDGVLFNKDKTKIICYPSGKTLSHYDIPNSVISIDVDAFGNCTFLKNIILSNNVAFIENWAFSNCISLKEIIIPDSVIYISEFSFLNCTSLKKIYISNNFNINLLDSCMLSTWEKVLNQAEIVGI